MLRTERTSIRSDSTAESRYSGARIMQAELRCLLFKSTLMGNVRESGQTRMRDDPDSVYACSVISIILGSQVIWQRSISIPVSNDDAALEDPDFKTLYDP